MKSLYLILQLIFLYTFGTAQQPFQLSIEDINLSEVVETTDHSYVASGWNLGKVVWDSIGFHNEGQGMALIKTNENGDTIWTRIYAVAGYNEFSRAESMVYMHEGGFLIAGGCYQCDETGSNLLVIRTNSDGDTLWTRRYSYELADYIMARSIIQTIDGNYLIVGEIRVPPEFSAAFLMKVSENGDVIWAKYLSSSFSAQAFSVLEEPDGSFVMDGNVNYGIDSDILLAKFNADGDLIWVRTFGGGEYDFAFDICHSHEGGYILTGGVASAGSGSTDICLLSIGVNGNLLWSKLYGGILGEEGQSILQTSDGYLLGGWTNSFGPEQGLYYIQKINDEGELVWLRTYSSEFSVPFDLIETSSGNYLAAGQDIELMEMNHDGLSGCQSISRTFTQLNDQIDTTSNLIELHDVDILIHPTYMYILSGAGAIGICEMVGLPHIVEQDCLSISPNPFFNRLEINIHNGTPKTAILLDIYGRLIQQVPLTMFSSHISFETNDLIPGHYFVKVLFSEGQIIEHMVKL